MNAHYKDILAEIQDRLFTIGAILATPQEKRYWKWRTTFAKLGILDRRRTFENDRMEPICHTWLICFTRWPPYCVTLSYCEMHMPSRRASAVHLNHNEPVAEIAITILNRLSDYLLSWHESCLWLKAEEVKWIQVIIGLKKRKILDLKLETKKKTFLTFF
jgi:cob(I)alamin adenosyltransferase